MSFRSSSIVKFAQSSLELTRNINSSYFNSVLNHCIRNDRPIDVFNAQMELMHIVASNIFRSAQVLARVRHSNLCYCQITKRIEVYSIVRRDSFTVFIPKNLGLWVSMCETFQRNRMVFKDTNVLLFDSKQRRRFSKKLILRLKFKRLKLNSHTGFNNGETRAA